MILIIRSHLVSVHLGTRPSTDTEAGGLVPMGGEAAGPRPALPLRMQEVVEAHSRKATGQGAQLPFSQRAPHKSLNTTPGPGETE